MNKKVKDMTIEERIQFKKDNKTGKVRVIKQDNEVESVEDKINAATSVDDLKDLLFEAMHGRLKPHKEIRSVITRKDIMIDNEP